MTLPEPVPGLVICYSYLWAAESAKGAEEELKARPCAIVAARQVIEGRLVVTVVPVTHTVPREPEDAIEIPAALKAHLGMDELPSWIVLTETNDFLWPGPDIRPVARGGVSRFEFGMLPPRYFAHLRDWILQAHLGRKVARILRTD